MDHIWLVELSRCWFPVEKKARYNTSIHTDRWSERISCLRFFLSVVINFFFFFEYGFPSGKLFILDSQPAQRTENGNVFIGYLFCLMVRN